MRSIRPFSKLQGNHPSVEARLALSNRLVLAERTNGSAAAVAGDQSKVSPTPSPARCRDPIGLLRPQLTPLYRCNRLKRYIFKRDAQVINLACEGLGTDDELLTRAICERNKAQLQLVKQAYFDKYKKTLEVRDPL